MSEGRYEVSIIGFVGDNWIELPDGTFLVPGYPPGSPPSYQSLPDGSWLADTAGTAAREIHQWRWIAPEPSHTNYPQQRNTRAEEITAARSRLSSRTESKDICCKPCETLKTVCRPSASPNEQYIVVPSNDPSVPESVRYDVCYSCYKRCTQGAKMYTGQDPSLCFDLETQNRRLQACDERKKSKQNEKMAALRARQETTFGTGSNPAKALSYNSVGAELMQGLRPTPVLVLEMTERASAEQRSAAPDKDLFKRAT